MKLRGAGWILGTAITFTAFATIAACSDSDSSIPDLQFDGGVNLSEASSGGNVGDGQVNVDGNSNPPGNDSGHPNDSGSSGADTGADVHVPAQCNDGKVDMGETCDPLASCPTDCQPQGCNIRALDNAGTCTAACSVVTVQTLCQNGDGCCPSDCNSINDNDCTATCGNGVKEAGEKCDGADCPTKCDPIGCNVFKLQGTDCQRECVVDAASEITACLPGVQDKCCPATCSSGTKPLDPDCAIPCGNGTLDNGETCDTGIASGPGACPTTCPSKECQTYKLANAGTCTAACVADTTINVCKNGDGCCAAGCDNTTDGDCAPVCGNGVVESGEKCDTKLPGSCPTDCPQQVCQLFKLENGGTCNAVCTANGTQGSCVNSDGCCPPACNNTTDNDCPVTVTCGDGKFDPSTETCDDSSPDGKCPVCPAPTSCLQNTGSANTCNLKCGVPISACTDGDKCCPFNKNGVACGAKGDNDCKGTAWAAITSPVLTLKATECTTIEVSGIETSASYDVTTCTGKGTVAIGDMDLSVNQLNGTSRPYVIGSNDFCALPESLPYRAGFSCQNKAGQDTGACVSQTTGGFLARNTQNLSIKVCAGAATASGPITVFYNAVKAPAFVTGK